MNCHNWYLCRVASCQRRLCTECVCRPPASLPSSSSSRSSPSSPSSSQASSATTGSSRRSPRRELPPRKAQDRCLSNGTGASPPCSGCLRHRRLSLGLLSREIMWMLKGREQMCGSRYLCLGQISRPMWAKPSGDSCAGECLPSLRTHKCSPQLAKTL